MEWKINVELVFRHFPAERVVEDDVGPGVVGLIFFLLLAKASIPGAEEALFWPIGLAVFLLLRFLRGALNPDERQPPLCPATTEALRRYGVEVLSRKTKPKTTHHHHSLKPSEPPHAASVEAAAA